MTTQEGERKMTTQEKVVVGVVAGIAILALIGVMLSSRPADIPKTECAKTELCSERDQLIDLRAEIRGKEKGFEAAREEAITIANLQLANKQLDEARQERDRLARRAEALEARVLTGGTARTESLVSPPDPCAVLSETAQKICARTRPR